MEQLEPWLPHLAAEDRARMLETWPGPHTWLVPCTREVPWLTGQFSSIALRLSDHPLVVALCQSLGHALVSTSANPQGRAPARSARTVRRYFASNVDYIVPGPTQGLFQPSSIHDLATGARLR